MSPQNNVTVLTTHEYLSTTPKLNGKPLCRLRAGAKKLSQLLYTYGNRWSWFQWYQYIAH